MVPIYIYTCIRVPPRVFDDGRIDLLGRDVNIPWCSSSGIRAVLGGGRYILFRTFSHSPLEAMRLYSSEYRNLLEVAVDKGLWFKPTLESR